ncbi:MAG TPA: IS110 family transposase [Dehalococcoidia bacterium]|nr:IS110 family transposase [Dehalococcoidia bacterium]
MENTAARKRKQVPEGYLIIGVDPHKKRHAAVAITQDFTIRDKFKFDNTREGLETMLRRVRMEMVESCCRGVMFAIETGGHYWRNIAYALDEQGIPFRFINQFTLKRRREGKDLNRRKNDYRDSEVAAQLLCTGEFTESKLPQGVYAELRTAHNSYRRLVKERTRITNLVKGLLDGLFPEFTQIFKDPCALTALSVLSICPVPSVIARITEDEFVTVIEAEHKGRLMRRKLRELHCSAKTSIGIDAGARSVSSEISFLVEKLELIRRHIGIIEGTLVRLLDETEEGKYLLSIRGLHYIAVAGLLAELGCFKAYRSAKQMIKMAGSNPTESESAGKKRSRTPMSKQGRPVLRYCAWTSVIPMLRFNSDFRNWAKQRRERPVHANPLGGREVVGAALNRLLRLAFAMVKNQTYYQVSKPELTMVAA